MTAKSFGSLSRPHEPLWRRSTALVLQGPPPRLTGAFKVVG